MPVLPTTAYSQSEDALTLERALVNTSAGVAFAGEVRQRRKPAEFVAEHLRGDDGHMAVEHEEFIWKVRRCGV